MMNFREIAEKTIKDAKVTKEKEVLVEKETIEKYLRDLGFKLRKETPLKNGKELEFYKQSDAEQAYEDLKMAGFIMDYNIDLANKYITYTNLV